MSNAYNNELSLYTTVPCDSRDTALSVILSQKAINNTVVLMMVDYPYLEMWKNSYHYGHLSSYTNLIIVCLDEVSYRV